MIPNTATDARIKALQDEAAADIDNHVINDLAVVLDISTAMLALHADGETRLAVAAIDRIRDLTDAAMTAGIGHLSIYPVGEVAHAHHDVTLTTIDDVLGRYPAALEKFANTHVAIDLAWQRHQLQRNRHTTLAVILGGLPDAPDLVEEKIAEIAKAIDVPAAFRVIFLTFEPAPADLEDWINDVELGLHATEDAHAIVTSHSIDDAAFTAAVLDPEYPPDGEGAADESATTEAAESDATPAEPAPETEPAEDDAEANSGA